MRHNGRTTLLDRRQQLDRLSLRANITGTPQAEFAFAQAEFAFAQAEDDLDAIEAQVKQMEDQYDRLPANIPPIREKPRK